MHRDLERSRRRGSGGCRRGLCLGDPRRDRVGVSCRGSLRARVGRLCAGGRRRRRRGRDRREQTAVARSSVARHAVSSGGEERGPHSVSAARASHVEGVVSQCLHWRAALGAAFACSGASRHHRCGRRCHCCVGVDTCTGRTCRVHRRRCMRHRSHMSRLDNAAAVGPERQGGHLVLLVRRRIPALDALEGGRTRQRGTEELQGAVVTAADRNVLRLQCGQRCVVGRCACHGGTRRGRRRSGRCGCGCGCAAGCSG